MLHASKYYIVREVGRHVRITRSHAAFESLEAMSNEHSRLLATLPVSTEVGLVIDLRDASGRNDPPFEEAMGDWRRGFARRFSRVAILVRTRIGVMQLNRLITIDKTPHVRTFKSEPDAISYAEP